MPLDSGEALVRALVGQAQEQARRERRLSLPEAPPGPPMESLAAWLEALECSEPVGAKVRRILILYRRVRALGGALPRRPVTLDLLARPSDDFPPDAIPARWQDRATRRYLHRRGLVGADGGRGIPVLGDFPQREG